MRDPATTSRAPLPREVVLLGWVSFFADVSGEMIVPLLPLFVVGVLGATGTTLGWVEGVAHAVVALLTAWAGWHSDRVRRRVRYVRVGYALPVAGKALIAVATAWPLVLAGRAIDRLGKGIRSSPRDALIADATEPAARGRAFGLHRAMDTAGAMVGVVLAGGFLWWFSGTPAPGAARPLGPDAAPAFRAVFAIAAAAGLASAGLTWLLREPPAPTATAAPPATSAPPAARRLGLGLPRAYWIVVALMLLFAVANSSDSFLLLRASDVGLSPWSIVLAYALFNAVYTALSYPAGVLSDRIGRWRVIAIGWAVYAVVYAGFALTSAGGVVPLLCGYGAYMALTDGVGKALIVDHVPAARRGLALGVYYAAFGAVTLLSSVAAGLLWDHVGHAAPFWFGAGAATVALVLLPAVLRVASADRR